MSFNAVESADWSDDETVPAETSDCNSCCKRCRGDWVLPAEAAEIEVMMAPWFLRGFAGILARRSHGLVYGLNDFLPPPGRSFSGYCEWTSCNISKHKSSPFGPILCLSKRIAIPNPNI